MNTDLTLLNRYHREGDTDAFQALVHTHAGMVFAAARRITLNAALAEEVAQDTFLALAKRGMAVNQSVAAWLHHVARQKACNARRGELRRQRHEHTAAEAWQDRQESSWSKVEPLLDEALDEMPEPARTLLIERFLEGCTQQEVALRRGLSQSTVSRLLNEAVSDLRVRLKAKGVVCGGGGLAVLLGAQGVEAAPATLAASLGKISLSGVGAGVPGANLAAYLTSLFMKSMASKLGLLGAAILLLGAAGYDLASKDSWLQHLTKRGKNKQRNPTETAATTESVAENKKHAATAATAKPQKMQPRAPAAKPGVAATKVDSPKVRLEKLAHLRTEAEFRALVAKLYAMGDPHRISEELRVLMGLDLNEKEVAQLLRGSAQTLEFGLLAHLAVRYPHEALGWLAMMQGSTISNSSVIFTQLFRSHPEITAESIGSTLPAGPNRELVLRTLRSQTDPVAEAQRFLAGNPDAGQRAQMLRSLAEHWPNNRASEGAAWAMQNLDSQDLLSFLPRLIPHLSSDSPDAALFLLGQINDPNLLSMTLVNALYGLLHDNHRVNDVLPLLDKFQGKQRAFAISELSRRWVRLDQEGLMQWINSLDAAADFEAALPLTLPQLSPENYAKAMDTLMPQLDGTLDAALIKAAAPDFGGTARATVDIIGRLTQLPQYHRIGSGQQGNQELLWQTVNTIASHWVSHQGAQAIQGAQWIDGLTFNTPADKAAVAARLYAEWNLSDPTAAAQWAARAGVKVP